ncbi:DUF3653 domain-containing protein [Vibrio sp. 10N.247.311.18]|uniref:DUF3653 domain-containing protein n=1 Tax=unclassified Vibrio TaxID=2614977 RepID=UPI00354E4979
MPLDHRWNGFRVHFDRATLITSERREFNPKELLSFAYWRNEYRQLVELHGRIDNLIKQAAKDNLMPFRGRRRMQTAPWAPSKYK